MPGQPAEPQKVLADVAGELTEVYVAPTLYERSTPLTPADNPPALYLRRDPATGRIYLGRRTT